MSMKRAFLVAICMTLVTAVAAQTTYQPKYKGDPARSDSEFVAIAYIKTFLRAQHLYKRKNQHYATSLLELRKTGSFTPRMASTDQGDYNVKFHANKQKDTFEITLVPKQQDPTHRSFFADDQGQIRVSEQGDADKSSPVLKPDEGH